MGNLQSKVDLEAKKKMIVAIFYIFENGHEMSSQWPKTCFDNDSASFRNVVYMFMTKICAI